MLLTRDNSFFHYFHSGCVRAPKNLRSADEDNDVATERERIHSDPSNSHNDILRMVDLVKVESLPDGREINHSH